MKRRLVVRWPFLILAALAVAIVGACWYFTRNMPDVPTRAPAAGMSKVEAWAITAGLVLVALAIPARTYRFLFISGAVLLILALFLL